MNTEQTNQSIELVTNKLDSYIAILAEKLGVAAEYVYPLFVKQQAIEGWWFFAACLFCIIPSSIVFLKQIKKDMDKTPVFLSAVISGAILLISFTTLATDGAKFFTKIVNPEYAAIQAIIQSIK